MENEKKKVIKTGIFVLSILVIVFSIAYAFLDITLMGTKTQAITAGNLKLFLDEGEAIQIQDALPMFDEVGMIQKPFTFRLVNETVYNTRYVLKLEDVTTGNKLDTNILRYGFTKQDITTIASISELSDYVLDRGIIYGEQSIEYAFRLWIDSDVEDEELIRDKSLSFRLLVEEAQVQSDYLSPNLSKHVRLSSLGTDVSQNIDYNLISSDTNGKGVYETSHTTNGNPIYFYRGAVDNNNVLFANYCWKIVRTTENGGVKLIYSGEPSQYGTCDNLGSSASIGKSIWNSLQNDNTYVGYMYGNSGATTYASAHSNTYSSSVKEMVDAWYENNIKDTTFEKYLDDSIFCSDRTMISDFSNFKYNDWTDHSKMGTLGYAQNPTMYGATARVGTALEFTNPTLACNQANDQLTVSSKNGTGTLQYPIGLLTADEAVYAGSTGGILGKTGLVNKDFYLYNGEMHFWTMSPHRFYNNQVVMLVVDSNGMVANEVATNEKLVRPVIVLKENTSILEGKGTVAEPYVITRINSTPSTPSKIPVTWRDKGIFSDYYEKAYDTLETLTLDEKIGQLFIVTYTASTSGAAVENYYAGGFTFYEVDFADKTEEEVKNMVSSLQSKTKIPLLMAVDEEGGNVIRISSNPNLVAEPFKSSKDLYDTGGLDSIRADTVQKSTILKNLGLNLNFAPVVDIADSTSYIYPRTLGQSPEVTGQFAKTVVEASRNTGVSYTLKHFPGYGNNADTHGTSSTDEKTLEELLESDMVPFQVGVSAGAESVMVAHNIVTAFDQDNPASLSKPIHSYLFSNLKFTGIAITDNLDMGATKEIENKYTKAIQAGNNILLISDYKTAHDQILASIQKGELTEEDINYLTFKVLAWKYYKGLL